MRSINMVTMIGNVASVPEMHETQNGKKICQFAIAVNRAWPDGSGDTEREVDFHKIIAWGKLAEICSEYLEKGKKILITGKLLNKVYESNNEKKYSTEIHLEQMELLTPKKKEESKELTTK